MNVLFCCFIFINYFCVPVIATAVAAIFVVFSLLLTLPLCSYCYSDFVVVATAVCLSVAAVVAFGVWFVCVHNAITIIA